MPTLLMRAFWLQPFHYGSLLGLVMLFIIYRIQTQERPDRQSVGDFSEHVQALMRPLHELTEHDYQLNERISELTNLVLDLKATKSVSPQELYQLAKVSMLYGDPNELYERAIITHEIHASQQGYTQLVLRNQIADGYWNKPYYLLALLISEMSKDPWSRLKWLMWFDADSVLLNPSFGVQVFLPPEDLSGVHFLVTKDDNGLNSGVFFVRVHEQSIRILTKSINYPEFKPDTNLGYSVDQMAMQLTFNESQFHQNIAYLPRPWFNANVNEPKEGDLLVHFPGLVDRDTHLKWWLEQVEGQEAVKWNVSLHQTDYDQRMGDFWKQFREMRELNATINEQYDLSLFPENATTAVENFADVVYYATDDAERMEQARIVLEDALGMHGL
nr:hypothetical protein LTR18_011118 [Exophiala xenobiotica]